MIDHALPLLDLHRHLEGCIRLETILELGRAHNLSLPAWEVEELRPYVQVTEPQPGVMAFIAKFEWMTGILVNYDACRRVAYENIIDAQAEGIDYVEMRFSPWFMAEPHGLNPDGVVEAVVDGINAARDDSGMHVNGIGILSRTYGPEVAWNELNALLSQADHLVALDLAGDEANFPGGLFVEHVEKARDSGLQITAHAGEAAGPESIWQAIQELGAARIGHAVHATADPTLMDYMRDNRIGIEANLTSNVQTSTVRDYASHPLGQFLDHGILATINTDDPGISGISLAYEYETAAPAAGLSQKQIRRAQQNALEIAFLQLEEKEELLARAAED
jgi:adenosine deaminase